MKKKLVFVIVLLMVIATSSLQLTYANLNDTALRDERIPILMYHHLTLEEPPQGREGEMISAQMFEKHMEFIKSAGFNTISAKELRNFLYNNGELPENPILITFDDGYESNYTLAFPVLQRLNMKAVISIIVNSRGKQPGEFMHFTWEEAQIMLDSGLIEIGSHTFDLHNYTIQKLPNESLIQYEDRIFNDFLIAKNSIQNLLKIDPFIFTYPYGMYNEYSQAIAYNLGFDMQFTVKPGIVTENSNPLALERINVPGNTTPQELLANIYKHMGIEATEPKVQYSVKIMETYIEANKLQLLHKEDIYSLEDGISNLQTQQLLLASVAKLEGSQIGESIINNLNRIKPTLERLANLEMSREPLTYKEALNYLRMIGNVDNISDFYSPEKPLTKVEFVDLYLQIIN